MAWRLAKDRPLHHHHPQHSNVFHSQSCHQGHGETAALNEKIFITKQQDKLAV